MYRRAATLMWAILCLGWGSNAQATLIDAIDALNPGDLYRVMFIGSTSISAISTDIEDYNAVAQADGANGAVTGPLGLTWKAVGSTETVDARDNTATVPSNELVTILNTFGDIVATSYEDLWDGTLNAVLNYTPDGVAVVNCGVNVSSASCAWSGTQSDGTATDRPLGTNIISLGQSAVTNSAWIDFSTLPPSDSGNVFLLPIYGISEVATVAAPPSGTVPVPTTFYLVALGLALLRLKCRKDKPPVESTFPL